MWRLKFILILTNWDEVVPLSKLSSEELPAYAWNENVSRKPISFILLPVNKFPFVTEMFCIVEMNS